MRRSHRGEVDPFIVMDVMEAARAAEAAGAQVIHMEVGQPAAGAPRPAIEAARAALGSGPLGYTESLGIPSLRARIARHYAEAYGLAVDPDRVIVTTGSSAGFILAFLSMFEAGDRVAIANPGYPPYRHLVSILVSGPAADAPLVALRELRARLEGAGVEADLLGPAPVLRLRGRHRAHLVAKTTQPRSVARQASALLAAAARTMRRDGLTAVVDVDPQSL